MEDDDMAEILEVQMRLQQEAIQIYEEKMKRKRELILKKEEEIRLARQRIAHITEGSKVRSRRPTVSTYDGDALPTDLIDAGPSKSESELSQDFEARISQAKSNYQTILLYYMEHFEVLDQVVASKERILHDLNKKLVALGVDVSDTATSDTAASLLPTKPASHSSPSQLVRREDFDLLSVLGMGAFGKVWRVRHKETKHIYAMKIMKKTSIVKRDFVDHTNKEREIMAEMSYHPFFVGLHHSFQTNERVYLIMDFVGGGSLFNYLSTAPRPFAQNVARFYAGEVALALEALHTNNIVYRDLKLENLLLDSDGHVRLSDFGLSAILKDNNDRIHSFSGTATYLAPEILSDRGEGHGKSVDFWCFGVMLFIMLTQEPPFWSENARELFHMIKNEELVWSNWDYLTPEAVGILKGLMTKNPAKRLGCGPEGWRGVREHAFFEGMDWAKLLAKKVKPPIRPKIKIGSAQEGHEEEVDDCDDEEEGGAQIAPSSEPEEYPVDLFAGFSFVASGVGQQSISVLDSNSRRSSGSSGGVGASISPSSSTSTSTSSSSSSSNSTFKKGRSNKVNVHFDLRIKGIKGISDGLNNERVFVTWKIDCKKDRLPVSKGETQVQLVTDREATWPAGDESTSIILDLILQQDKKTFSFKERKINFLLKTATKKPITLGEVTLNLSDFAIHKDDQTQILALARNGPTLVLQVKCEYELFNGKKLVEWLDTKAGAGQIINLNGIMYLLQ